MVDNYYAVVQQPSKFEVYTSEGKVEIDRKAILSIKPLSDQHGAIILLKDYQ